MLRNKKTRNQRLILSYFQMVEWGIMGNKKYFGERVGVIKQGEFDFEMFRKLFSNLYKRLENECF